MVHSKREEWEKLDKNNIYFEFIKSCLSKKYGPKDGECHIHHIIPQYAFSKNPEETAYRDSSENLIVLSPADHLKAHELLYSVFGNKQDLGAIAMLKGYLSESRRIWRQLGAEASHKIQKENKKTFFNSEFQKEMAQRSLALPNALENRSKGGKVGGVKRNLDRVITADKRYVFNYHGTEVLCILNCRTGGQVLEQLNSFKKTPLQRTTFLLTGKRETMYGWSCTPLEV